MKSVTVNEWKWREAGADEWTKCAHNNPVTEIYTDLLDAEKIPDPFIDRHEFDVQWVADKVWEYSAEFECEQVDAEFHDLVFEGLDTIATVYLNGDKILESDNMFHIHRVPVKAQSKNVLRIVFASALQHGRELEKQHGEMVVSNGEGSRAYVRKAQYHYGWDWGPMLMSCGPYKPVRLESYSSNITDVYVEADVHEDLTADVNVNLELKSKHNVEIQVELIAPSGVVTASSVRAQETGKAQFHLETPQLWYPRGQGEPNLYTVKVTTEAQVVEKTVGVRRVELVQHELKDQPGTSFFFKINNNPVFCYGSNWIPGHNYLTQLSPQDYYDWIHRAVDSNQNMIRVWGGGIFEPDEFYAECDRVGIMVWQDFMFACGQYPYYPEFRKSVCREAQDQLKRLRNFCSIVIYAGNNEDYQIAEEAHLEWDPKDQSGDWTHTNFPARTAYETDLPHYVKQLTRVPYHPGSPWGGKTCGDPTVGDNHQWNVWHGTQEKYQNWAKLASRFVSEFGMLAFPHRSTVDKCVTDPAERYPQSIVMDSHNKAAGFERRLALYVMENIKVGSMELDSWIYATQLMQMECIAYAYRCWRREWRGESREYVAGALVWQINDCWPVTSWALVDFYGHKKLAYFAVKRECAPVMVGIYRTTPEDKQGTQKKDIPPNVLNDKKHIFDVWGVNSTLQPLSVNLELFAYNVESGQLVKDYGSKQVELSANQSTEVLANVSTHQDVVLFARLRCPSTGQVIARAGDWPQPLKYLKMPDRQLQANVHDGCVELTASRPVKGVRLSIGEEDLRADWQDNGVDVFPNETVVVQAPGLNQNDKVRIEYYQM